MKLYELIFSFLRIFTLGVVEGVSASGGSAGGTTAGSDGSGDKGGSQSPPPDQKTSSGSGAGAPGGAGVAAGAPDVTFVGKDGKFTEAFYERYPQAKKYSDLDSFGKGFTNLSTMVGKQDKVTIPGEHASPEEIALFRQKMGIPDTPEGYGIEKPKEFKGKPLPEGFWEGSGIPNYVTKFHELGLTPAQGKALIDFGLENGLKSFTDTTGAIEKARADGEAKLKADWGSDYDAFLGMAERGAAAVGLTKEMVASDPALANNPNFIRAMKQVGIMTGETVNAAGSRTATTMSDPSTRIRELQTLMGSRDYKKSSAYAHHQANMAELQQLIAIKEKLRR